MAINDVLPLKVARCDAVAKRKFLDLGHKRLNLDGSIYIRYAVLLYSAGTVIVASVYGRWVKTPADFSSTGLVLSRWEPSQNK